LLHAPEQAFINIDDRCIYNCAFCNNARSSKSRFLKNYDDKKFIDLILKVSQRPDFKGVALTSGIYPNNKAIIKRMVHIIEGIRKKLPSIPIGVEPCINEKKEIIQLKEAGADEIKINIQAANKDIFERVCPDMDYEKIFQMLDYAVEIFGKNKVTSNIIYGLGEKKLDIINSIEKLVNIGVVPNLRLVKISNTNKKRIENVVGKSLGKLPTADYMVSLAKQCKEILRKNNLTTLEFKTMCHKCTCCDIVPFYDV
jgi:biotin synthase-related radical SAM superfamily protein